MIGLAIGLGILGFCAMRRARRCHGGCGYGSGGGYGDGYGGGGGGWGGPPWMWHHHHHHGGRHGRKRWMLHMALARIDATPAQERAIVAEVDKLEERMHAAKASLKDARIDLAGALRGPILDDAALGGVLGRADTATGEMRAAILDALRNVHAILDDGQRHQLADLLERGRPGRWRGGGGGPYRV
jgi:uncharacterized membrane protein